MNIRRIFTSLAPYKLALAIAVFLLVLIASISYTQIKNLQKSANLVSQSLIVDKEINTLFSNFNILESIAFRSIIVQDSIFPYMQNDYKVQAENSLAKLYELTDDIPEQKKTLDAITLLKDSLFVTYSELSDKMDWPKGEGVSVEGEVKSIATIGNRLRQYKTTLTFIKTDLLRTRLAEYSSQSTITPLTSLILAIFSLGVFIIAFRTIDVDRKRIASSEEFLQSVLRSTDNIMNYYEPVYGTSGKITDFKIIFANECNYDYLGLHPEEITGKLISAVFPLFSINGEFNGLVRCVEQKETIDIEHQISVHGHKMWFRTIIKPLSIGVLVTARNNTSEKEGEEKLRLANESLINKNNELETTQALLESVLKSTKNVIMSFEPELGRNGVPINFRYRYINERIFDIIGSRPDEIVGKKASEINPGIFESGVFEKLVTCYVKNTPVEYESIQNINGKKYWFLGTAIRSGNLVTVTSTDFTKEKNAILDLSSVNEKLAIQNSIMIEAKRMAKIGSYIWNVQTGVTEISDNFYRIIGYDPTEFAPSFEAFRSLVHPDDIKGYDQIGRNVIKKKTPTEFSYRIFAKNGDIKYLKTKGQFIKTNGEEKLIGVVQDVTEFLRVEGELRTRNLQLMRSNDELEAFNRVASHDLQEPLRKIQMFISRIEESEMKKLTSQGKTYFEKVVAAANRMQSLILNLLTYSRIESAHENFSKIDLNLVLNSVIENLSEQVRGAKVKIIVKDKLPKINGVSFQMEQLFTNLISNAIKYRNPKIQCKILLDTSKVHRDQITIPFYKPSNSYYKIIVSDNGIGFGQDQAEKIFEIFQRLHSKTEYSGTGIGLAICKKIVLNHQGYIHAQGDPGKGSTFYIYLPA